MAFMPGAQEGWPRTTAGRRRRREHIRFFGRGRRAGREGFAAQCRFSSLTNSPKMLEAQQTAELLPFGRAAQSYAGRRPDFRSARFTKKPGA
jgi:hypothetical protein